MPLVIRPATRADLDPIRRIYNQGIEDRSTLEALPKSPGQMLAWYKAHDRRYSVVIAELDGIVAGWASINRYSPRAAHKGIADLSIYIERAARGLGIGQALLAAIERHAHICAFDKIVLMTFPFNVRSRALFDRCGYRTVGIYRHQGRLAGALVDTLAMEKLIPPAAAATQSRRARPKSRVLSQPSRWR